jgi:hypothetical protein
MLSINCHLLEFFMRSTFIAYFAFAVLFALCACTSSPSGASQDAAAPSSSSNKTKASPTSVFGSFTPQQKIAENVNGRGFVLGAAGPMLTAFIDPNCSFCNNFYRQIMPLVSARKVRLRVILVGFVKPSSLPRAAAIVDAPAPTIALDDNEKNFNSAREEGAYPIAGSSTSSEKKVKEDTALLAKLELSVPALVGCAQGRGLFFVAGLPKDVPALIATLDPAPVDPACQ